MVTDRVRIDGLGAARDHLARPGDAAGSVLVVAVDGTVPAWLAELVAQAQAAGAAVVVEAAAPAGLDEESRAGWEIGVATAALAAGAEVAGIDARRLARVREVTRALDAARPDPAPEPAS